MDALMCPSRFFFLFSLEWDVRLTPDGSPALFVAQLGNLSRRGCRFVCFFPLFFLPFVHTPPPAAAAARRTSQSLRVQSMKWWHPRRTSKSPWQFWKRADSRKWLSQGRQRPIALDGCDTPGHFLRLPESEQRKGPGCQAAPFSRSSLRVIILHFAAALRIFPSRGGKVVKLCTHVLYVKIFLICSCF